MRAANNILKRDDAGIENDIRNLERTKKHFLPFFTELKNTGFDFSKDDFHRLAHGKAENLVLWLKEKTIEQHPSLNVPHITKQAKLDMIALKDYSALMQTHKNITALPNKKDVLAFDIQEGELKISAKKMQGIIDSRTNYGTDAGAEVLQMCESIKSIADDCLQKHGFNPLTNNLFSFDYINGSTEIHVPAIEAAFQKVTRNLTEKISN